MVEAAVATRCGALEAATVVARCEVVEEAFVAARCGVVDACVLVSILLSNL